MYLKGSKLRMDRQRRKRRSNPALILFLLGLIAAVVYFDQFVIPALPITQAETPTATTNPEALEAEADQLTAEGSFFQAINVYRRAILSNPSDPNLHVKLAHVQTLAGEYEAAETSAQNALLLNPENPKAFAELGWALKFLGDEVGAEHALEQSLALDANNANAHAYYAEILMDKFDVEGASEHSNLAKDLEPNSFITRRARGYVLYYTGNFDLAVIEFEAALAINDRVADLHLLLGLTYWSQGLLDQAIDEFNIASSFDPGNPLPDTYVSRIYINLGDYGKASQSAKAALDKEPGNPRRWGNWGVALYKNVQYQEAIDALTYAIQGGIAPNGMAITGLPLGSETAEFYYVYGLALARSRRCTEALPIFQALYAAVPGDDTAIANAEIGIGICEEFSSSPPTATPAAETTLPDLTGAPPAEATPTPTPTPTESPDSMNEG